jgi:hypothetical protein
MKTIFWIFALPIVVTCGGVFAATWTIETTANLSEPWVAGPTNTSNQAFARLHLLNAPTGTVLAIGLITIDTNPPASTVVSNGSILINSAPPSAKDYSTIQSMTGMPAIVTVPSP